MNEGPFIQSHESFTASNEYDKKRYNCFEFVSETLFGNKDTIDFNPDDDDLTPLFDLVSNPQHANAVGFKVNTRNSKPYLTHMGIISTQSGESIVEHIPNVGQAKQKITLTEFFSQYNEPNSEVIFLKKK